MHVFCDLDSHTSVCVLARLQDPDIVRIFLHSCIVVGCELGKKWVIQTVLDVECDRQCVKWILSTGLIVGLHVDKESLLICKMVVIFDLVVELVRVHLHLLALGGIGGLRVL